MTWLVGWRKVSYFSLIAVGCAVEPMYAYDATGGGSGTDHSGGAASGALGVAGSLPNTGGTPYTACTGAFEEIQSGGSGGLCIAKMVTIPGPVSSTNDASVADYTIDVTEVTRGQYEAWVATNPPLPASDDPICGKKQGYAADARCMTGAGSSDCGTTPHKVCKTNCELHPQVCVDWCDAYAYCAAVGKRLCGAIGSGANPFDDFVNPDKSQWFRACSAAGANDYPYSGEYNSANCNVFDRSQDYKTVVVGFLEDCVTATGVYDLSGNVREWEDSCDSTDDTCRQRGGSFGGNDFRISCAYGMSAKRYLACDYYGFRCCGR